MPNIKLESGKTYVTENGDVVKLYCFSGWLQFCFKTDVDSSLSHERWTEDGVAHHSDCGNSIVSEHRK